MNDVFIHNSLLIVHYSLLVFLLACYKAEDYNTNNMIKLRPAILSFHALRGMSCQTLCIAGGTQSVRASFPRRAWERDGKPA